MALVHLLVTGVGSMYTLSQSTAMVLAPATYCWVKSFYTTTLSTNLLPTLLLAYRIWRVDRRVAGVRSTKGPLHPVLSVVIDSGLLYSFMLVAALASGSHGQNIISDMVNPFRPLNSIDLFVFRIK